MKKTLREQLQSRVWQYERVVDQLKSNSKHYLDKKQYSALAENESKIEVYLKVIENLKDLLDNY